MEDEPANIVPLPTEGRKSMQFTLGEAARQCGVAKGTISKAIATGKLSATRREDGSWSIDAAELARYLTSNGHRFRSETSAPDRLETLTVAHNAMVAALQKTIATLEKANASLEDKYRSLEQDRDVWREQAQQLALPAPKPNETPAATPPTVIEMLSGQGVVPPEEAAPVIRLAMTGRQRALRFWFGREYRRRAG
jgi:hypothetical protein